MKRSRIGLVLLQALLVAACRDTSGPRGPVESIALSATALTVGPSESVELIASPRNAAGEVIPGIQVEWASSDPLVATVSAGQVTGVGFGTATITASAGGKFAEAVATVTATQRHHVAGTWRLHSFDGKAVPATYAFYPDEPTDIGVVDVEIRLDSAKMLLRSDGVYPSRLYCFTEVQAGIERFRYCWGDHGGFAVPQPGAVSLWSEYIQNLSASGTVTSAGALRLSEPLWVGEAARSTEWRR